MTPEVDATQADIAYLMEEIRTNLLVSPGGDQTSGTSRAQAWLLTLLSFYGDQLTVLVDLYRLFRQENSYQLLSFVIEHLLQHQLNEIDHNRYLQEEFQLIFTASSNRLVSKEVSASTFSYARLYALLSASTRDLISSSLIRQWYEELEQNLLVSASSIESLNKWREKALACLSLSSSSIASILELVVKTEGKLDCHRHSSSLNVLRCLFVQDLLPIALENRSRLNVQAHLCHRWLIYAIEFYMEYWLTCYQKNQQTNIHIPLEGNQQMFQCDHPIKQLDQLMESAIDGKENFDWQQFSINNATQNRSSNRRQQLLELRILLDRGQYSTIRCPLECFLFSTSFPIYIQSILNLSSFLNDPTFQDSLFISSTPSIKTRLKNQHELNNLEFIENFYLFIQCLTLFQSSSTASCCQLYQEMIEKIHLPEHIAVYQRLLQIFYFYHVMEKSKEQTPTTITDAKKTIIIDDTPASPTMQDESNGQSTSPARQSPLHAPDLETLMSQLKVDSLESRLQLCSLYSICSSKNQRRLTVSFCLDTLIDLQENHRTSTAPTSITFISADYCFLPRSYAIYFDYLLDILRQHVTPTLVLQQIDHQQQASTLYSKHLLPTLTPASLRYIYDTKLLGQLLKYIQSSTSVERRWQSHQHKRKLDEEETKLTDEQFIEKIIQHVSNVTQWTDEQRRTAIYTYLIDERQSLLPVD